MNVSFIALGTEQLGISQLSAIAKRDGHNVNLAFSAQLFHDRFNLELPSIAPFFDDTDKVITELNRQKPDVIAFGALTSTYQWGLQVARGAKAHNENVKVIFGGVHPSAVPDLVLSKPEIDYVTIGEGDVAFSKVLSQIEKGDYNTPIVNTRYKAPNGQVIKGIQGGFYQDLDTLPFYDKILWEDHVRLGDLYLTMASRGCPYRCTFCFNSFFARLPEEKSGKYVRLRSPEHVIMELKWAKNRYHLRWVDFQDDVFTTNKKWLAEFLALYKKEINLPFQILTHPRYFDNDIAMWLKDAGCEWIQMGVQSMDESFKKDSLMRYEKSDDVSLCLELMIKHKINAKVDHMFGLPEEPISAQESARNLYSLHTPKRIQTFWTCYLPGTQMMNEAIELGRISSEQVNRINEGTELYFFRNTDNIKEPEKMHLYKAYEVIFRLMPSMPNWLKVRIQPQHLKWIPKFLVRPLSMIGDLVSGLFHANPEFLAYSWHNLLHLSNFFIPKIGLKPIKANKIKADIPVSVFQKPVVEDKLKTGSEA